MSGASLYELFRQPYVLNIFCDASLKRRGDTTDICYVAIAVNKDNIIDSIYRVNTDSTNNKGEAMAILAGLQLANMYKYTYSVINIFSDSQVSILNIRDRYKNWTFIDDNYYIKSGGVLSNQEVYIQILQMICECDLHINFFHQKGHVNSKSFKDIVHATKVFSTSNRIGREIDYSFIRYISGYNNIVDAYSRSTLSRMDTVNNKVICPFNYYATEELLNKYKKRGSNYEWKKFVS